MFRSGIIRRKGSCYGIYPPIVIHLPQSRQQTSNPLGENRHTNSQGRPTYPGFKTQLPMTNTACVINEVVGANLTTLYNLHGDEIEECLTRKTSF